MKRKVRAEVKESDRYIKKLEGFHEISSHNRRIAEEWGNADDIKAMYGNKKKLSMPFNPNDGSKGLTYVRIKFIHA